MKDILTTFLTLAVLAAVFPDTLVWDVALVICALILIIYVPVER